jgi:hypothetical protein
MELKLEKFARELMDAGFKVAVSKTHPFKWLKFERDGYIGGIDAHDYRGYSFTTVHKPCQRYGTAFQVTDYGELKLEYAMACLVRVPAHFGCVRNEIKKYKDLTEFIQSTHNKWCEYYILDDTNFPKELA